MLPAIEVNTEHGHILVYGLTKYEFGMHRVEQLAAMVEADGGVMIAAHPYRRYMPWYHLEGDDLQRGLEQAMANPAYKHCVALETLHGRGAPQQNEFSERLREMLGMRGSGGSDAHQPDHVGRCATRFERRIRSPGRSHRRAEGGTLRAGRPAARRAGGRTASTPFDTN